MLVRRIANLITLPLIVRGGEKENYENYFFIGE
jgi:hypothetical protein